MWQYKMGGKSGGEWIHVYVWLTHSAVHLKLPQHYLLVGYTPIQNKILSFFFNILFMDLKCPPFLLIIPCVF